MVSGRVRREVRIPAYWLAVGILIAVASPILSVLASRTIAVENAQRLISKQEQAQRAQSQTFVNATCDLFRRQLEAYDQTPPTTAAGRNIRDAWLTEYRLYHCVPAR